MKAMVKDSEAFQRCMKLFTDGGGVVNLQYAESFKVMQRLFPEDWIMMHHESLAMITVKLPPSGCFSLLHPNISFWELERDDFYPLEENE